MQMEKNECSAKGAQPALSTTGIRFQPEEAKKPVAKAAVAPNSALPSLTASAFPQRKVLATTQS